MYRPVCITDHHLHPALAPMVAPYLDHCLLAEVSKYTSGETTHAMAQVVQAYVCSISLAELEIKDLTAAGVSAETPELRDYRVKITEYEKQLRVFVLRGRMQAARVSSPYQSRDTNHFLP